MAWYDFFGKPPSTPGGAYDYSMILPTVLPTAMTLAAGLFAGDGPDLPYGSTEAGFNAELAYKQAALAQQKELEMAQINASMANAAAAAGATKAAAAMAANASRKNTIDVQVGENYVNRAKLAADRMALRIAAKKGDPAVLQAASENIIQSLAAQAAAAESGFANSANLMAQFRK